MTGHVIRLGNGATIGKDGKLVIKRKPRDASEAKRWAAGGSQRVQVVKPRSQVKNPVTGTWTKRDDKSGKFMDEGVRKERKRDDDPVTRIEVIDETGRSYVRYGVSVELSYQDEGRTLKVFVRSRGAEAEQRTKAEMAEGLRQFISVVKPRSRIKNPTTGTWTKRGNRT
jgi:hypothetical protein